MKLFDESGLRLTRRHFFGRSASGIGMAALAGLLRQDLRAENLPGKKAHRGLPGLPHFAPKAKCVVYLFQSGGPSQMELFDYKPRLTEFQGQDLPDSVRKGQRLTGMSATQSSFPVVPSKFQFAQHGKSGAWVSELMPYTAKAADHLTFRHGSQTICFVVRAEPQTFVGRAHHLGYRAGPSAGAGGGARAEWRCGELVA